MSIESGVGGYLQSHQCSNYMSCLLSDCLKMKSITTKDVHQFLSMYNFYRSFHRGNQTQQLEN